MMFDILCPSLSIIGGTERFPVRRIFCAGRNYAAHAKEMGSDGKTPPFFFMKPLTALLPIDDGRVHDLPYPPGTQDYHHEVEFVVALKSGGADIAADEAMPHVFGCAIGLDMTRRDLQKASSEKGQPWELGKTADFSAPVGPLHQLGDISIQQGSITLKLNDDLKQSGDLSDMIWNVPELISILSRHYTLNAGDLIFTGTPEGVGPVVRGDGIEAAIEGFSFLNMRVV